ncbi:MAG TPA: hypothetical protein VGA52_00925 [Anaerolineales bacterium]
MENPDLTNLVAVVIGLLLLGLVLSGVLAVWIIARVRRLHLPPDADLLTALRLTPFSVVLLLDLLDFSLDIFAAPIAWGLLSYLGLRPLRGITVVESLIPGTQVLPTMTIAWLVARLVKRDSWPLPGV